MDRVPLPFGRTDRVDLAPALAKWLRQEAKRIGPLTTRPLPAHVLDAIPALALADLILSRSAT
jgi:hypothetical protein